MELNEAIKKLEQCGYIVEYMSVIHPSQLLSSEKIFSEFANDLNKNVFPGEDFGYEVRAYNKPKHLHSCIEIKLKDLDGYTLKVATIDYLTIDGKKRFSISPSYKSTINLGELPKNDAEWDFVADVIVEIVEEFIKLKKKEGMI